MKKKKFIFIFLLIVVISVGFSAISATLSITGNSTIARNTWDVHFENVQVTSGSVTASTPVISNNDTQVTYNVTLNMPGDYYEFTVDAVNDGTIDAMIQTFSNTGLTTEQEKYLSYSIEYANGGDVANKHLLAHGDTTTYKVRVYYRTDLEATDLPTSDQTISLTFSVDYVQADSTAIEVVTSYVVSNTPMYIGQSIPSGVKLRSTPALAMADWADIISTQESSSQLYLKLIISNNILSASYAEFIVSPEMVAENPGMIAGTYSLRAGIDESSTPTKRVYETNKGILLRSFGSTSSTNCESATSYFVCTTEDGDFLFQAWVYMNGLVMVSDAHNSCGANNSGLTVCETDLH